MSLQDLTNPAPSSTWECPSRDATARMGAGAESRYLIPCVSRLQAGQPSDQVAVRRGTRTLAGVGLIRSSPDGGRQRRRSLTAWLWSFAVWMLVIWFAVFMFNR
jgi:hypothetical protein